MSLLKSTIIRLILFTAFLFVAVTPALANVEIRLSPDPITENTPTATVTFLNLVPGTKYFFTSVQSGSGNKQSLGNITASSSSITLTVCGAANNFVKTDCSGSNWFNVNKTYKILISIEQGGTLRELGSKSFKVQPASSSEINVTLTNSGKSFTVTITGLRQPENEPDRNTYDFELKGKAPDGTTINTSNPLNLPVPPSGSAQRTFGLTQNGTYTLGVGFTEENSMLKTFTIKITDAGVVISESAGGNSRGEPGENPCGNPATECRTALGNIPTNPTAFVGKILTVAIGLAGGIALIIMVWGSIKVLTSGGEPKKMGEGREMIVAAVSGLLFLILSVLILRFIGSTFLPTTPF